MIFISVIGIKLNLLSLRIKRCLYVLELYLLQINAKTAAKKNNKQTNKNYIHIGRIEISYSCAYIYRYTDI